MRLAAAGLLVVVAVTSTFIVVAFRSDMQRAHERIGGHAVIAPSPFGDVEYSLRGSGPPVLISHGAGGGFDQGELVAEAVLGDDFRGLSPSRFGYLGSTTRGGGTYDDQAHAYAWLLDHLGFERVAVVAISAGAPSALIFTALYPDRVSSLTLLSAGVTAVTTEDQSGADAKGSMLIRLFRFDFPYWLITKLFRRQVVGLMGADAGIVADLGSEQRDLTNRMIDYMNPASARYAGVVLDNRNMLPGERIGDISAPTLIIHAEDDSLQLYENAAFAAATIPDARLVRFERGGHFVAIVEQATIRAEVRRHILDNLR